MKKLMIAAAIVCAAAVSQAAAVDWKANGSSAESGYSLYFLTSAAGDWTSEADIQKVAIGTGSIANQGRGSFAGTGTVDNSALTKAMSSLTVAVVTADGTKYATTSVSLGSYVYDPHANPPESSTGTATFSVSGLSYTAFQTVPEPTSGLLLLLGVAGLALRRKQK